MDIKDKITQTLIGITAQLQEISSEFYIIGASAMILSNIKIGETSDIDILTTEMNASKLQYLLKAYMEVSPETKENDLFHSNFAKSRRIIFGNLFVYKNIEKFQLEKWLSEYQQLKSKKEFYLFLVEKKI